MSQPYVGEIRLFAGNFAPAGWSFCSGQLLPISEYETLFNLIGTTYGGDGQATFGLPDFSSRAPIHVGTGPGATYILAQTGGVEIVTLNAQQIPIHTHPLIASSGAATKSNPAGNVLADGAPQMYIEAAGNNPMAANSTTSVGGNQPHDNVQPFLVLSFIISLFGIFPHT